MTIHVQHEQPQTRAARANWLPAPYGPFYVVLTDPSTLSFGSTFRRRQRVADCGSRPRSPASTDLRSAEQPKDGREVSVDGA